jgi:hypothetical protein
MRGILGEVEDQKKVWSSKLSIHDVFGLRLSSPLIYSGRPTFLYMAWNLGSERRGSQLDDWTVPHEDPWPRSFGKLRIS